MVNLQDSVIVRLTSCILFGHTLFIHLCQFANNEVVHTKNSAIAVMQVFIRTNSHGAFDAVDWICSATL